MEERYQRVAKFLATCTELVEGKFIAADAKISEALKGIATSKELTELFTAVTQGFDYAAARRSYLRFPAGRGATHGAMLLPSDRKDILAFVFCLMVEFDAGTLQLDDFLLRYFYVDGSYTASYLVFSERVIRPFRDIVRDCFPEAVEKAHGVNAQAQGEIFGSIAELLPAEQHRLARFNLLEEELAAANLLLSGLSTAVGRNDVVTFSALLAGYKYFLRYFNGEDDESAAIFALAAKL